MPYRFPPSPCIIAGSLALAALMPCLPARAGLLTTVLSANAGHYNAASADFTTGTVSNLSPRRPGGAAFTVAVPLAAAPKPSTRAMLAGGGVLLLLRWVWRGRGRDSGIGL